MQKIFTLVLLLPLLTACPFSGEDAQTPNGLERLRTQPAGTWQWTIKATGDSADLVLTASTFTESGITLYKVEPNVVFGPTTMKGIGLHTENDVEKFAYFGEGGTEPGSTLNIVGTEGNAIILGGDSPSETSEVSRFEYIGR